MRGSPLALTLWWAGECVISLFVAVLTFLAQGNPDHPELVTPLWWAQWGAICFAAFEGLMFSGCLVLMVPMAVAEGVRSLVRPMNRNA